MSVEGVEVFVDMVYDAVSSVVIPEIMIKMSEVVKNLTSRISAIEN